MKLSTDEIRKFFELHLQAQRIAMRDRVVVRCPFHEDRTPSLSLNFVDGVWKCHAGCGEGGMIDFEMKYSGVDRQDATARINQMLGFEVFGSGRTPEAVYQYRDAFGRLVFEKIRLPGKEFRARHWKGAKWIYNLDDVQKPLYRLPELIVANEVFICEGEKDVDNLLLASKGKEGPDIHVSATTNFDGAGKWQPEYGPYFAGKVVVILPDHDDIGAAHAARIAAAVKPFAAGVKIVNLPDLENHGDVSDYLQSHSFEDILERVKSTPAWRLPPVEQHLFVPADVFASKADADLQWLVDGVIQQGANGFIAAAPKVGKSWTALDLAIALAFGKPWLGFNVAEPHRVALVSREDHPGLTAWRMGQLYRGRQSGDPTLISRNLMVNSRAQSPELMIDNDDQMAELIEAMQVFGPELAIFDVFNVLHAADENDNTEMRKVLRRLSQVQAETKCAIAVIHHYNKGEGSMTQRLRGASAIAGWVEWLIGVSMADNDTKVRKMEFELKAAAPPDPIYYNIISRDSMTSIDRVSWANVTPRSAESYLVSRGKEAAAGL